MTQSRQNSAKYQETLDFMYRQLPMYQRQGKSAFKKDLSNIIALCNVLGNPQDKFRILHVAGTNGKGSTSHIIASILQEQGYQVGLYTSPHYMDFRERIKINGIFVDHEFVVDFIEKLKPALIEISASFFELTVAMAFSYFEQQKVDFAVIETGLGGRLDSTNIVTPLVSIITNISMDHMSMLGDSLAKIAFEKAGIIKPGIPVVVGESAIATNHVFHEKARNVESPLYFAKDVVGIELVDLCYDLERSKSPFQNKNIRTALATIAILVEQELLSKDLEAAKRGILNLHKNTYFIGRWMVLGSHPMVITDSAHNEAGMELVLDRIKKLYFSQLHIVVGFVNDKDVTNILRLFPPDAKYYFAKADIARGLDAKELKQIALPLGIKGRSYVSVRNAFQAARRSAAEKDLVFIGGSIFVVAELLAHIGLPGK